MKTEKAKSSCWSHSTKNHNKCRKQVSIFSNWIENIQINSQEELEKEINFEIVKNIKKQWDRGAEDSTFEVIFLNIYDFS